MIRWEWDAGKAAGNLRKHGIAFELAILVFDDPFALTDPDPHDDGDRMRTIGVPVRGPSAILFVVHADAVLLNGEWVGRIVSSRRSTARERADYEETQR